MKSLFLFVVTFLSVFLANHLGFDKKIISNRAPSGFAPETNNRFIVPDFIESYNKESILNDTQNRISDDFHISEPLRQRVSFWFDIYTKYSASEEVIHHTEYPWVIFKVVDLSHILNGPGNKWTRYHKAKKFGDVKVAEIRKTLAQLAKKKNYSKLSEKEQVLFDALLAIPGPRKKIIQEAARSVRAQVGQREYIEQGLTASSLYLPEIEKIFKEKGLPFELTRLPFVESSFNVNAVSKVGASGIWQVMPFIGKKFLIMNPVVDERNSPIKSAHTAAFILNQNKKILKKWPLALTAYNHGTGSLLKGIKKTGSNDLNVLIKKYHAKSFGFASQNFYASFLAILYSERYQETIFPRIIRLSPLKFKEFKLNKSIPIKEILQLSGLSMEEFRKFNLDIRHIAIKKNYRLPKGYVVHIPEENYALFNENQRGLKIASLVEKQKKTLKF